jgi:hypothetical protein
MMDPADSQERADDLALVTNLSLLDLTGSGAASHSRAPETPRKLEMQAQIRHLQEQLAAQQAVLEEETAARKAAQDEAKSANEAAAAKQAVLDAKQAELKEAQDEAKSANEAAAAKQAVLDAKQAELDEEMRNGMFRDLELQKKIEELKLFKINPRSLILSALPEVDDISSLKSSTSRAAERVKVTVVKPLHGFKKMQGEFTVSILADLERREDVHNIPPGTLRDGMHRAGSEQDLNSILDYTAFFSLNRLLDDVTCSSVAKGKFPYNADGAIYLTKELELMLLCEFKRHNLTVYGLDLVLNCNIKMNDRDNREVSLDSLDAVQQLVGYMILAKLRYGILTTYQYWWVVELCDNGEVLISEAYCWSDTGEYSVQAMLHYVVHLARTSRGKFSTPVLPPVLSPRAKKDQPDSGGGGGGDDKENQGFNGQGRKGGSSSGSKGKGKGGQASKVGGGKSACDASGGHRNAASLEFLRYLAENKNQITFQARLATGGSCGAGRLAAIKAYDTEEARDREVARHRRLRGLLGMPRVLKERLELEWSEAEERRVHAFVLEWVGPEDAGGARFGGARAAPLPVHGLKQVREVLGGMHRCGVAHGDLHEDNLVWDAAAGRAYVVDLSLGSTRGEADFVAECHEDMACVDRMLASARARDSDASAARLVR